jgi:2-C-methyl-D-erythritol 2,4-cyclodiphosphate synthase
MTDTRVGHGFDVHAFAANRKLIIGGVDIPHDVGLAGHSDADVLLHAICDALLGAAGLGDIGRHFPDTDAAFAGIDSRILLRRVAEQLQQRGWRIGNVDATIIAQAPKMAPHIARMSAYMPTTRHRLDRVNVGDAPPKGSASQGAAKASRPRCAWIGRD